MSTLLELPLNSDDFTANLAQRLRADNSRISASEIANFCGLTPQTVNGWLNGATPPGGLITVKLAHLMQLVGFDSPELELLHEEQPLNAFLCRLLGFSVVQMDEARDICGEVGVQAVLNACRGSKILRPKYKRVRDFPGQYADELAEAIDIRRRLLGISSDDPIVATLPVQAPPASKQVVQPVPSPVVQPDPEMLDDLVARVVAALRPQQLGQSFVNHSGDMRQDAVVRVAERLLSMLPVVIIAKEQFSDEERALLRKLMGEEVMFQLSTLLNQLCSTRAFGDGR